MSRRKRSSSPEECGSWMDTYGDMVTLLLCFFVMLYSMSTLNNEKWKIFVRSIHPAVSNEKPPTEVYEPYGFVSLTEPEPTVIDPPTNLNEDVELDAMYLELAKTLDDAGIPGVTVSRGKDYTYIVFQNKTFFDGDSSILTDTGKETLDIFCEALTPLVDNISQVNIMAHTAQGDPNRPNNPRTDRMLSAMRAAEVCIFIQAKDIILPERMVDISYGQFRPITENETTEGRAQNRRVELLLIDMDADVRSLNEYYDEFTSNQNKTYTTDGVAGQSKEGFERRDAGEVPGEMPASTQPPL